MSAGDLVSGEIKDKRERFQQWAHQFSIHGQQPDAWDAWQAALSVAEVAEEPVAWMYPSDIEKFASQETFATVFSVQVGCPDELSVPLYTRPAAHDDLVKALQMAKHIVAAEGTTEQLNQVFAALELAGIQP